jgi:hypothetical protein
MTNEEIYLGFNPEEIEAIRTEVKTRWGKKQLQETEDNITKLGTKGWQNTKKREDEINKTLAGLMNHRPDDIIVQQAIELHFKYINTFYDVSKKRYLGLGNMYVEDDRFKSYYNNYRNGLAQFIKEGIEEFCINNLQVRVYKP